jgi:ubiquinone/menaquinone biosynthesis C-methylase UbiE
MNARVFQRFITLLVISLLSAAGLPAQSARENTADAEWLVKVLEIRPGTIVGEIGAGSGELTFAIARAVGDSGRVFSNELNKDRVKAIERQAEQAGVKNVSVVEGRQLETNFPDECCDAIFMRNVYHHFGDPPAMNASLLKSLKPGGRLAVIDFTPPPPPGGENPPGRRGEDNHHGITLATLEREVKAAGFEIVSADEKNRAVTLVARRPLTLPAP